jgi:outer membrane protein TolC
VERPNCLALVAAIWLSLSPPASAQTASTAPLPLPALPIFPVQQPAPGGTNPILGAIPHGDLTTQPMNLGLRDAIDRGLRYNLDLLLSAASSDQARAALLEQYSRLLPQVGASLRQTYQVTNLHAFGLNFAPGIPATVGVNNTDARAALTAPVIDLSARSSERAARAAVTAAEWEARDVREAVTLAVASTYLQAIATESALVAARADLETAQALYIVAGARERAGAAPELDTLRAQVEMQSRQLAVTQAQNSVDKQRLALLRIVGLPLRQAIVLTSRVPYYPAAAISLDEQLARAFASRSDYKSAQAQLESAERSARAAALERWPVLTVSADYGALGTSPATMLPTWSATGQLRVPVFDGGRISSDILRATAAVDQRQAELADLRVRIEQDVTSAVLDIRSAGEQVEVATTTIEYAQHALRDAQARFTNGLTNNVEVVQAQEALVNANNQYVNASYAHNLAKVMLARAIGSAEATINDLFRLAGAPAGGR